MRRLIVTHQIALVFLAVVLVAFLGVVSNTRTVNDYKDRFCRLALSVTEPIPEPSATTPTGADNSYSLGRTQLRNRQLASQREQLIGTRTSC